MGEGNGQMKRLFAFFARHFELGEILFAAGMILLHCGVRASISLSWANTVCGIILVVVGVLIGRDGK